MTRALVSTLPATRRRPARAAGALLAFGLVGLAPRAQAQGSTAQSAPAAAAPGGSESTTAVDPASAAPAETGAAQPGPVGTETREARDLTLPREVDKPWQVLGEAQYRALVVRDTDPANDQRMYYRLQLNYEVVKDLILSARAGIVQRFVTVEDESGVRMEDASFAALLQQSISLEGIGWDRQLSLAHRLRVYLPTSFRSQEEDLLFAAELSSRARVRITGQLFAGVLGLVQYHAHQYAEQAGPGGAALPRVVAQGLAFAEYSPLVSPDLGTLTFGADVYLNQTFGYPSRDPADIPASELPPGTLADDPDSIIGAGTTDVFSSPNFGYDLYAQYQPPFEHLLFMASLEQVGSAQRYGETRVYLFHRDETELALRLIVTY